MLDKVDVVVAIIRRPLLLPRDVASEIKEIAACQLPVLRVLRPNRRLEHEPVVVAYRLQEEIEKELLH